MFRPCVWAIGHGSATCRKKLGHKRAFQDVQGGRVLTIGEHAYCQHVPVFRQISQCYIRRALPNHQVHSDQALEDNGPC